MKSIVDQVAEVLDEACWDSHRRIHPNFKESKLNEQPEHEITVGNYTTKFFYMCPSAKKAMTANKTTIGAESLTRLQDDFYKLEKQVMDAGEASDEQKEQARELYNKIMQKAGEIGLADDIDDYMKMHIDSIEKGDPKPGFGIIDEKLDKEDKPKVKEIIGKLKKASGTHAGQAKDLERAMNEDGHTDVASAIRQCKTIMEDTTQMMSKLQSMNPEDALPSWWTNKLAVASNTMNNLRDYFLFPTSESVLKENENTKVKQDRDVADEPGTQPAKYYKGLSKSEKEARAKHFAKGSSAPAPGDEGAKTKESKHTKKFKQMYGEEYIEEKNEGLKNKSSKSGISYGILKKVYDRGMAAWKTGHRPGTTPQQWAMARVNSFITKGKGTWGGADSDLASKVRKEGLGEASSLAQQAAIAISKKKSGKYDEDGKRIKEETCCDDCLHMAEGLEHEDILIIENGEKKNVTLNKPQRGGSKKFYVYVKNDKDNIVKVSFGDPNMEIKRDDPARRKSFRARHNCDNPGPKWKARYWSCRQWRADSKVED
jgi:hypothetical protein